MMRNLFWKEWREQRWKMAFGCVMLVSFCAIGLRARMVPDFTIIILTAFFGGPLLALLTAMGVVGRDRGEGSLDYLLALPVAPYRVLGVKMLVGLANCFVPVLGVGLVASIVAGGREMTFLQIFGTVGVGLWLATHLLVWSVAIGIRQPSEARAGLVGVGVIVGWGLYFLLIMAITPNTATTPFFLALTPLTCLGLGDYAPHMAHFEGYPMWIGLLALAFAAQSLWLVGLSWWGVRRFSRLGGRSA